MAKRTRARARQSKRVPARKSAILTPTPSHPLAGGGNGEAAAKTKAKPGVKPGTPSWRKFNYTPALLADCRYRYEETPETNVSIARDYGISDTTVRRLAKDNGWSKFPVSRVDMPDAVKLRQRAAALAAEAEGGAVRASAFPPPERGRARVGGNEVPAPLAPTPTRPPPAGDLLLSGGGEQVALAGGGNGEAAAGSQQSDPQEHAAAVAAAINDLLTGARQLLAEVVAMRARRNEPRTPLDAQRLAQTYASLNATLKDLQRAQDDTRAEQRTGYFDDDMPADLDALREDLARRIAAFMESRPDDEDAVEAAGGRAEPPAS